MPDQTISAEARDSRTATSGEPRRNFVVKAVAVIAGAIVAIVPAAAGLFTFLDPLRAGGKGAAGSATKRLYRVRDGAWIAGVCSGLAAYFGQDATVFRPKGCDACRGGGYKGRVGLFEVVPITPEIASLISSRAPLPKLRETAHASGIQLLRDAGMIKVREGLTSLEEVLAITLAEE